MLHSLTFGVSLLVIVLTLAGIAIGRLRGGWGMSLP